MQVSVQSNGLERRLTVELPAQQIEDEVGRRLRSLAQRVRLDGFRPGKVPMRVVEQRYGKQVRDEVSSELVQSSFSEAATRERLRVAGSPQIELVSHGQGQALQYTARFEVYPEFKVNVPGDLAVSKPTVEITAADVDQMLERLRKQRTRFVAVERGAQNGDRIVMDFVGSVDGVPFPGGEAKDFPLVLGSNGLIPGFEDQLLGARAGESHTVEVNFPADYHAPELAGKHASFAVRVTSVSEPQLPSLDEEFAATFGIKEGGVEKLRTEVEATMRREIDRLVKDRVKTQVMDALLAANPIELPKGLIDQEITRLQEQVRQNFGPLRAKELGDQPGYYEERAKRRVALGLIIAELIKLNQLRSAPDKLRVAVEEIAGSYEDPAEVVQWYYASAERLNGVEAMLLEDQAVEVVLSGAQVMDIPTSYESLTAGAQAV